MSIDVQNYTFRQGKWSAVIFSGAWEDFGRENTLPLRGFWRFLLCGQILLGALIGSWSLVHAIQAERSQSRLSRMNEAEFLNGRNFGKR